MHDVAHCRDRAARFRELATDTDDRTAADLLRLANDYEVEAQRLERLAKPADE